MNIPSSTLHAAPGNPIPDGADIRLAEAADGVALRVATWRPSGAEVAGTVLLMQGRAEFIEKYAETVSGLVARGFAVVAFDWRGQGASGRRVGDAAKGHVDDFAEYRLDVAAVAAHMGAAGLPRPFVGLAHSMGGCVALSGAAGGWLPVDRLVALAPMIELRMVKRPRLVRILLRALAALGLGRNYVPGGDGRSISTLSFPGNRLSADEGRYIRNARLAEAMGAAAIGAPSIAWLAAAYRAMDRLRAPGVAEAIAMPVLTVAAGEDPVCLTPAILAVAERIPAGQIIVIPEARHEILMETDPIRAAFWDAFDAFTRMSASR